MIVERFLTWAETAPTHLRASAGSALARAFLADRFDEDERDEAEAALTALVEDDEAEVRAAVAKVIGDDARTPRHLVAILAADQPEIAMPVIALSPVFIDAELVDMAATGSAAQQIAIACRKPLSSAVSAALAEVGEVESSIALLMNEAAQITPNFLHRIAERHIESEDVQKFMARRRDLLPQTWLMLIECATDRLRRQYETRKWLPTKRIEAMVGEQFDKAVIAFATALTHGELQTLIAELVAKEKLSTAFLLRSVCMGNITLFACALAFLAKVPVDRVVAIVERRPGHALKALYGQAGLPQAAYIVFAELLTCWRDKLEKAGEGAGEQLPRLVTREVLGRVGHNLDGELDNLLVLLRKIAAENERDGARSEINRIIERANERSKLAIAPPTAEHAGEAASSDAEIDLSDDVIFEYAEYFAEELVDLEAAVAAELSVSFANDTDAVVTHHSANQFDVPDVAPDDPGPAANDDLPVKVKDGRRARVTRAA